MEVMIRIQAKFHKQTCLEQACWERVGMISEVWKALKLQAFLTVDSQNDTDLIR
jgi:hypothetical protein